MKRFSRAIGVAMAAMFVLATAALATHSSEVTFSKNPANTGDVVLVAANAIGTHHSGNGVIRLDVCQTFNEDFSWGAYRPSADCATALDGATWRDLVSKQTTGGPDSVTYSFATALTEVPLVGFRSRYTPDGGSGAVDTQDLTILYPTGGGHSGCNGIENAYEQVTTNNGAVQGKGNSAKALEKVAAKLGCDLAP